MNLELAYSRPQGTANALGEVAHDRHRFLTKSVLLTGETPVLLTQNGNCCFLDSIRLLVRICPNVTVAIPPACARLREAAGMVAQRVAFGKEIVFLDESLDFAGYHAILSVGSGVRPDLPWTAVNSNGWIARVSSGDKQLPSTCDVHNPIGALAAACLGAGDVFKRLIGLRPERGELLNGLMYSLREYREIACEDYGPAMPEDLRGDILVVGAGAIGNGLAHLIAQLPFRSRISIVDSQAYGTENLGTFILIGPGDLKKTNAEVLAEHLEQAIKNARGFHMPFEQFANETSNIPAIVINGLDDIDVRHEVQRRLWPDMIIDGAIGDFTCQVSRHPWPDDVACLICLFRRADAERSEDIQSKATGLSIAALHAPAALVTQVDVDNAPAQKQEFLRSRIGRPVCSVIQEGIAHEISLEEQQDEFQPSVPFVACFSACMVISEAVAHICGWPSVLAPRYQFDFLTGPAYGQELSQGRRIDCICTRRKNIEAVRAAHRIQRD